MAKLMCEACRGGGCPACDAGWVEAEGAEQLGRPVPAGAAVEYWAHLSVARSALARYEREVPEGAATSPAPDWLSWAVLLRRVLAGLVGAIDGLDQAAEVES